MFTCYLIFSLFFVPISVVFVLGISRIQMQAILIIITILAFIETILNIFTGFYDQGELIL